MFNGKMKAVTFSYDDGITQDQRLIEIFDRYGLKCTFNLNSELLGKPGSLVRDDVTVAHVKPRPQEVAGIYRGHEVAVHALTHPDLTKLDEAEVIRQVEQDRLNLSEMVGYEVVGMAYPYGTVNDAVAGAIRKHTGVRYSRTTESTLNFEPQEDLICFNPTVYHRQWDELFRLGEEFLRLQPDSPKIFYIWGHAYEFDIDNSWARMEEFCKMISGREDTFYGTNAQVLLGE